MNGPIKMYQTRRFVRHDIPVELPKCMYALKNIHSRNGMVDGAVDHVSTENKKLDIFDQVKQFLKVSFISNIIFVLLATFNASKASLNIVLTKISLKNHLHDTIVINFCEQLSNN